MSASTMAEWDRSRYLSERGASRDDPYYISQEEERLLEERRLRDHLRQMEAVNAELIDACVYVADELTQYLEQFCPHDHTSRALRDRLRAAIAKATGAKP